MVFGASDAAKGRWTSVAIRSLDRKDPTGNDSPHRICASEWRRESPHRAQRKSPQGQAMKVPQGQEMRELIAHRTPNPNEKNNSQALNLCTGLGLALRLPHPATKSTMFFCTFVLVEGGSNPPPARGGR